MSADRRYQLQSEPGNRAVDALLEQLRVPESSWRLYSEMLITVLKMFEDGAGVVDLKITSAALKEMRYGVKVFAPWRSVPKVTVFGSARTPPEHPVSRQAAAFGRRMREAGWMVMTGAGSGVMGAAQEGAGRERSFGLNIRLPFEQEANPWIADDPKLITFKYFFTRKLFLVKEAHAFAMFPGGFGTMDETFESLTLMQTGKSTIVPIVLVEAGPRPYWRTWDAWLRGTLVEHGYIAEEDLEFYRIVDSVEDAVREIAGFYRVFHSARIVVDNLVFRLTRPLAASDLAEIQERFDDILKGRLDQVMGPAPQELREFPELPRLVIPFTRQSYSRLRQLIDFINARPE